MQLKWARLLSGALRSRSLFIPGRIHPNLKSSVYCSAIAYGGVEEWNFAWSMFKSATLASEASRLRGALACTRQPWLLNRYASCQARVSPVLMLAYTVVCIHG